jgi:hypothetical protein
MRNLGIALGLAVAVLAPMGAAAQLEQGNCELTLSAADDLPQGPFDPGEQRTYTFVAENTGDFEADGTFRITSPLPSGWYWTPTEQPVSIASGETQEIDVDVRFEGDVERDAQLQANVQDYGCDVPNSGGQSTQTVSLAFTHAPVTEGGDGGGLPVAWIVFGAIVAGTVVGVPVVYRNRQPRVGAACEDSERDVQPGRGTSYPIELENEGSDAVQVELEVTDVQEGWSALTTLPSLELGPDEDRTVYMMVRAPEDAKPGDLCVAKLGVTPEDGSTREIKTLTRVDEDAPAEDETAMEPSGEEEP